jgi:hypothetical protein
VIGRQRIAVALALTLFTVPLSSLWMAPSVPRPPILSSEPALLATAPAGDRRSVDMFGNEVSSAVATYKLDATGNLYEEHSPQTELPRLGSPIS